MISTLDVVGTQRGEWPVPISTSSGAAGATLLWRRHGRTYLTAVVKATFRLIPGGVMAQVPSEPIVHDEQEDGAGLRAAGDLVPFRPRTDVVITGHAFAPPSDPHAVPVRFSLLRDGAPVLDKPASLQRPKGTPPGVVRLAGLGPLSRHWPIRRRLLGSHDPRRLEGASIELPPSFDESYFQAAPVDQRVDGLRGDEQIVFEGVRPAGARMETRLPGARAAARLHGPSGEPGGARALALAIDALHVDLDRGICNVTWRGVTPVVREDELASMHLVAAVELSDRAPALSAPGEDLEARISLDSRRLWATPLSELVDKAALPPPKAPPPRAPPPRSEASKEEEPSTLKLADFVLPEPEPLEEIEEAPLESTMYLSQDDLLVEAAEPPPSAQTPLPPPRLPPRRVAPPASEEHTSTLILDELELIEPEEPHPLESTAALSLEVALQIGAAPATPFESGARPAAVPLAPQPPPFPAIALETRARPEAEASPWAAESPPSSRPWPSVAAAPEPIAAIAIAAPAPVWLGPPAAAEPTGAMTFGAHFLAAMELFEGTSDPT